MGRARGKLRPPVSRRLTTDHSRLPSSQNNLPDRRAAGPGGRPAANPCVQKHLFTGYLPYANLGALVRGRQSAPGRVPGAAVSTAGIGSASGGDSHKARACPPMVAACGMPRRVGRRPYGCDTEHGTCLNWETCICDIADSANSTGRVPRWGSVACGCLPRGIVGT